MMRQLQEEQLSAKEIIRTAMGRLPRFEINALHKETYGVLLRYKMIYYKEKVDRLLRGLRLAPEIQKKLRTALLRPIKVGDKNMIISWKRLRGG